jgi:rubrerythrin
MGKVFQKRTEDFRCEQCHFLVTGNGYTNHCPRCLYSKHVDVFPGDREESCGGLMEPLYSLQEQGQERLVHRCLICGKTRKNKVQEEDDFETLVTLNKKRILTDL